MRWGVTSWKWRTMYNHQLWSQFDSWQLSHNRIHKLLCKGNS